MSSVPNMDEQIKKMWCNYTMEYYLALNRKEILSLATMWINLGDIMLSEINKSQKDKYCMIPLT